METVAPTIMERLRDMHSKLRQEVEDLDSEALHWTPGPDTSSIAILVNHIVGSEGEVLRTVRGLSSDRVRESEFVQGSETAEHLLRRLEQADALLEELGSAIGPNDLLALRPRPRRPQPNTGLFWIIESYGHLHEHLAQVQLTKQLYLQRERG